ncbi:MAG: tRNA lysidine(34) synthetase TilS [Oligoflexales bacterium]
MERVQEGVKNTVRRLAAEGKSLWIACSGGPDSIALVHYLAPFKGLLPIQVLHVNYGLRGEESEGDAAFVVSECERLGLSVEVLTVEEEPPGSGIQEWARDLRYAWFRTKIGTDRGVVALAHHRDDLAETLLMRLARGTSGLHLEAMKQWSGALWRPLLDIAKSEIMEWLSRQNLPYRVDGSNDTLKYDRNVIRHKILPELENLYPKASVKLSQIAKEIGDLTAFVREHIQPHAVQDKLSANWLRLQSLGVGLEAIRMYLEQNLNPENLKSLSRSKMYEAMSRVQSSELKWEMEIAAGIYLTLCDEYLSVQKSHVRKSHEQRKNQHIGNLEDISLELQLAPGDSCEVFWNDGNYLLVPSVGPKVKKYDLKPKMDLAENNAKEGNNTKIPWRSAPSVY